MQRYLPNPLKRPEHPSLLRPISGIFADRPASLVKFPLTPLKVYPLCIFGSATYLHAVFISM